MVFSPHTVHAVCRTLFHSLWIGLAVAILTGITITLTKRSSPKLRYNLFCAMLLLFLASTGMVFFIEFNPRPTTAANQTGVVLSNYTDPWSAWIAGTWLVCAVLKSVRLCGQLIYLRKVRRTGIQEVSPRWQNKTAALAERIGIQKKVRLLEAALIRVPVTIGYFRPLILIPAGLLFQLTPGQTESILYHELAHILRRDYLVNILQSIVEALFFFHPAIWWLSALIREEREACCDELVLSHIPQKSAYLEALITFQQNTAPQSKLAMGLGHPQLLHRLRRMVSQENRQLNQAEKIILLAGFSLLLAFAFVPKASQTATQGAAFVGRKVVSALQQLSPETPTPLPATHPRKLTKISTAPQIFPADTIPIAPVQPKFQPDESGFEAAKARARNIITALISQKVVTGRSAIDWFGLSADELVINGIKQPEALHRQFKQTFGIEPGNGVYYGPVKTNGKGDFLNKSDL